MRILSNLHVNGKPAVLPDRAIRRQSHYFIYRPRKAAYTVAMSYWWLDIVSELKIKQIVKKIQNYINMWIQDAGELAEMH